MMFGNIGLNGRPSPAIGDGHRDHKLPSNHYLGSGEAPADHHGPDIKLMVKQAPILGRAWGKDKDRKPLDPPPVVQLLDQRPHIYDSPYLFMICSLLAEHPDPDDGDVELPTSYLSGARTSSIYHLKDTSNMYGGFFVFGDLSVRHEGKFRLRFSLYDRDDHSQAPNFYFVSQIITEPVTIYSPKKFPGMPQSTLLTRAFCDQGVKLRLRKDGRSLSTKKRTQNTPTESPAVQRNQDPQRLTPSQNLSPSTHPARFEVLGSGGNSFGVQGLPMVSQPLSSQSPMPAMHYGAMQPPTSLSGSPSMGVTYAQNYSSGMGLPVSSNFAPAGGGYSMPMPMPINYSNAYSGYIDNSMPQQLPDRGREQSQAYYGGGYQLGFNPGRESQSAATSGPEQVHPSTHGFREDAGGWMDQRQASGPMYPSSQFYRDAP